MDVQAHDSNNYLSKAQMYLDNEAQQEKRDLQPEPSKWNKIVPDAKL